MKLALMGNIGAGKTSVSNYLESKYGYVSLNCDLIVKDLYIENKELINKVNKEFLNTTNDFVDKDELKKVVFNNKSRLLELEKMVYPYLLEYMSKYKDEDVIYDCQQIEKLNLKVDYKVYIQIDEDVEIQRVIMRDNRSKKEIKKIIELQKTYKYDYDYKILNNSTLEDCYIQVDEIMRSINENNR